MQLTSANTKKAKQPAPTYKSWLSGQFGILLGLVLLAFTAIAFASLATWSINDPSLSNANGNITQNAGGFLGASFANLMMQFFGLASTVALVPVAVWGWLKLIKKPIGFIKKRIIAWPLSVIATSAALGCLPISQTWPLPAGMGGVAGDLILSIPGFIIGDYPSNIFAIIFFVLLILPAIGLTLFASGLTNRPAKTDPNGFNLDQEETDENGSIRVGLIGALFGGLGAITHWVLTFRAMRKRKKQESAQFTEPTMQAPHSAAPQMDNAMDANFDDMNAQPKTGLVQRISNAYNELTSPSDDGLEAFDDKPYTPMAVEPQFNTHPSDYITAPEAAPQYGEQVYNDAQHYEPQIAESEPALENMAEQTAAPAAPLSQTNRIKAPAPKPKPSSRISRESQGSLLPTDDFELPQLEFLSEHKNIVKDATLSNEALEANARLLESVLDDFGVKGEIIQVHPGPVVTLYEL
ncbi:MAG: DNA translocase FtsK 4TM domain-containing protein, partial [Nitratireductor sp.]